jgi:hypothetical protein
MESLESLLSQALKHASEGKCTRHETREIHSLIRSSYGNPLNWRPGGLVELIHRADDGTLSNLGLFRESYYNRTSARRLQRFNGDPTSEPSRVEFVEGAHWVGPVADSSYHKYEDTPQDLAELKKQFDELVLEIEDELYSGS